MPWGSPAESACPLPKMAPRRGFISGHRTVLVLNDWVPAGRPVELAGSPHRGPAGRHHPRVARNLPRVRSEGYRFGGRGGSAARPARARAIREPDGERGDAPVPPRDAGTLSRRRPDHPGALLEGRIEA